MYLHNAITAGLAYVCVISWQVKRRYSSPGKILPSLHLSPGKVYKWTFQEERARTEFLGLAKISPEYGLSCNEWPSFRHENKLWKDAALHIRDSTFSNILLTSKHKSHLFLYLFFA